uniref:Uncharacterized protein n=1 Tax=Picea glauca TaxID=3330 RepID=A0A101M345_PICGL|nr:hypothetical protein ABT39_MTgene3296 [Picea glauca]
MGQARSTTIPIDWPQRKRNSIGWSSSIVSFMVTHQSLFFLMWAFSIRSVLCGFFSGRGGRTWEVVTPQGNTTTTTIVPSYHGYLITTIGG